MITDFGEDIKREKAHLHNLYLRQVTYNKFGSNIKRFKIVDLFNSKTRREFGKTSG